MMHGQTQIIFILRFVSYLQHFPVGQCQSHLSHVSIPDIYLIYLLSRYALIIFEVGKASLNEHERLCQFSAMKNI